jgi:dolichol kinase
MSSIQLNLIPDVKAQYLKAERTRKTAIVGVALGKKAGQFKIYGQRKSFFGSLTFMAISFFINAVYWYFNLAALPADLQNWIFVSALSFGVASILTLAELLSPKGSDNIIVPVLAGLLVLLPAAF